MAIGLIGSPATWIDTSNRKQAFVLRTDGALWSVSETPNGWSAWPFHATPRAVPLRRSPAVVSNQSGWLERFAVGDDGGLWHIWQLAFVYLKLFLGDGNAQGQDVIWH